MQGPNIKSKLVARYSCGAAVSPRQVLMFIYQKRRTYCTHENEIPFFIVDIRAVSRLPAACNQQNFVSCPINSTAIPRPNVYLLTLNLTLIIPAESYLFLCFFF